jgi:hypothetical protein
VVVVFSGAGRLPLVSSFTAALVAKLWFGALMVELPAVVVKNFNPTSVDWSYSSAKLCKIAVVAPLWPV